MTAFLSRVSRRVDGPSPGAFDLEDGLQVDEGCLVALCFNPDLRLARLEAERVLAGSAHAERWADPEFAFSVLRIDESVPDRWVVSPNLGFTLPLSGRLSAEGDLARAEYASAELRVLESEARVAREVRSAWSEWSASTLRVEETERLVLLLDGLVGTASQLREIGELPATEAALFEIERAQERHHLGRRRGEERVARERLRALLGLAPEAEVDLVPAASSPSAPRVERPLAEGRDACADRNPTLARLRADYTVAERALAREIRRQYPDLTLGPAFESDAGQSRIGLFGGLPLPLWNANRRGIAEAEVAREIARAAFEAGYERWVASIARASGEWHARMEQREGLEESLVPLVDAQLENALRALQLGEGASLVLLESLGRAHEVKMDLIATDLALDLARIELDALTSLPLAHSVELPARTTDSEGLNR